jgi:asparagine synthase (glutamine-hydrolysing)
MCAIHGFCWTDKKIMGEMLCKAHHRGPDGQGKWNNDNISLGHNLLSITDTPDVSQQPWEHNDLVLVFNGEIYNHIELRKTLDYKFKTDTDTETLVVGLEKRGIKFIYELDGMFAFACYNKTNKKIWLVRDVNGSKPLYYGHLDGKLAFSSEVKSLLECGFERKVDKEAFGHFYKQGYVAGHLTLFDKIRKLTPGQIIQYDTVSNLRIVSNINKHGYAKGYAPDIFKIKDKLNKAVEKTLMGKREIGLFLSGGIDSSAILYEMTELGYNPKCYSTHFPTTDIKSRLNEDCTIGKEYAKARKCEHIMVNETEEGFIKSFEDTIYALEEPRQSKSLASYFNTNKRIAEDDVVVTMSGDGGDELFAGYKHHRIPNWQIKLKALCANHKELKSELWITEEQQWEYLKEWLVQDNLKFKLEDNMIPDLHDFMYIERMNTLAEDFLIRNDKLGMAHGLEGRFPFLCNDFRNYISGIESAFLTNADFQTGDWSRFNKQLLKAAYQDHLPKHIINRAKTGWRFPTDELLIGRYTAPAEDSKLREWVKEILSDKELQDIFEFTEEEIEDKFLQRGKWGKGVNKSGNPTIFPNSGIKSQKELWTILAFATWKKVFKMNI